MLKFKPVQLKRVHRLKVYDQLLDIGTPDKGYKFHIALNGVRVAKKFSDNTTTVKQLLSRFGENIYFYCIPRIKTGMIDNNRLEKTGQLRARTYCTKNLQHALMHNRGFKRPILGTKCKVVMFTDKGPKPTRASDRSSYEYRSTRPVVLAVIELSLHRKLTDAREINRRD